MFSRRAKLMSGHPNKLEELDFGLAFTLGFLYVTFFWALGWRCRDKGGEGWSRGNATETPVLWDVELLNTSLSLAGFVFLVVCRWTGHVRIRESYIRQKYPKQTEIGNFLLALSSWSMGRISVGSDSFWCLQDPQPQNRNPQTGKKGHSPM